ncbi:MAG: hypothetical protein GXP55_13325 [Deltaproteobacteria bacterium]|nr:hypothetical protein [Deltaproteobacteria bacterium]
MSSPDPRPYLIVTSILDSVARAADATLSHGDAFERALAAAEGQDVAGIDLVELPVAPHVFAALRKHLGAPNSQVGLYDVFPLASHLDLEMRKVAGQFLAADALWTLESQQLLGGIPLNLHIDLPKDWEHDPKKVHERLMSAGALDLSPQGIETFKCVKQAWDADVIPMAPMAQTA